MKVIGHRDGYRDEPSSVLVEMSTNELNIIVNGSHAKECKASLSSVREVDICKKFFHSQEVLKAVEAVKNLPAELRVIADLLGLVIPKAKMIACQEDEEEAGEVAS